jgi:flagellar hook-basal body complex protein FliE
VSEAQNHSVAQAHSFETGSSDVSLSDVMIDMQKANIQFQTALQVRNKLVSAYTDVMQMQV